MVACRELKPRAVVEAGRKVGISDLKKDFFVMFQKHADPWWNLAFCFAIPVFLFGYSAVDPDGFSAIARRSARRQPSAC